MKKKFNLPDYQYRRSNKKWIIVEITASEIKTIEQTVRENLKRALPEEFVYKTTGKAVKQIKVERPNLKIK